MDGLAPNRTFDPLMTRLERIAAERAYAQPAAGICQRCGEHKGYAGTTTRVLHERKCEPRERT